MNEEAAHGRPTTVPYVQLDVSEYESAMGRLRGARDSAQQALKTLEDQLAPVLTPAENETFDGRIGEVAPPQAPIVSQVNDEARWIEEIAAQIGRVRGRLAV